MSCATRREGTKPGPLPYLEGVEEQLVVHLDLPRDARDVGVWHGHEHDIVDAEQRHQHQGGL